MKLSKEAVKIIADAFEHFQEQSEDTKEQSHFGAIVEATRNLPLNQTLELKTIELVPITSDYIANLLVATMQSHEYDSQERIEAENAFYDYLSTHHDYHIEEYADQLDHCDMEGAITFALYKAAVNGTMRILPL